MKSKALPPFGQDYVGGGLPDSSGEAQQLALNCYIASIRVGVHPIRAAALLIIAELKGGRS